MLLAREEIKEKVGCDLKEKIKGSAITAQLSSSSSIADVYTIYLLSEKVGEDQDSLRDALVKHVTKEWIPNLQIDKWKMVQTVTTQEEVGGELETTERQEEVQMGTDMLKVAEVLAGLISHSSALQKEIGTKLDSALQLLVKKVYNTDHGFFVTKKADMDMAEFTHHALRAIATFNARAKGKKIATNGLLSRDYFLTKASVAKDLQSAGTALRGLLLATGGDAVPFATLKGSKPGLDLNEKGSFAVQITDAVGSAVDLSGREVTKVVLVKADQRVKLTDKAAVDGATGVVTV